MDQIVTLIGSLGFPIAACVAMGVYIVKRDKSEQDSREKFATALDKNTEAINALKEEIKCGKAN